MNEEELRHERDRLRLLLEITNSMTSRLDLRRLVEALSPKLRNSINHVTCDRTSVYVIDFNRTLKIREAQVVHRQN